VKLGVDVSVFDPCAQVLRHVKSTSSSTVETASGPSFAEDYPSAKRVLVYRGDKRLRIDGVLCIPCAEFLASIVPGRDLPG
jgi:hypothetical protein